MTCTCRDVVVTRRALQPQLHLLQVASQLLFQLSMVSNAGLGNGGAHRAAYLWIGLVLLAKADGELSGRPRELGIGLLLVPE